MGTQGWQFDNMCMDVDASSGKLVNYWCSPGGSWQAQKWQVNDAVAETSTKIMARGSCAAQNPPPADCRAPKAYNRCMDGCDDDPDHDVRQSQPGSMVITLARGKT